MCQVKALCADLSENNGHGSMFLNFPIRGVMKTMASDGLNTFPVLLQLAQNMIKKKTKTFLFNLISNNLLSKVHGEKMEKGHFNSKGRKDKSNK